jgi:hypothetical protein
VNEQDTAGPAGWTGDQQVEQLTSSSQSSDESSHEIPAGENSPNPLANSHEIPSGEPGSPINGLGRLERSSSPEQPLEELSGIMVKRLKK